MIKRIIAALLLVGVVMAVAWASQPSKVVVVCDESIPPCFHVSDQPSEDELWQELMRRARRNGGRIELDENDPLGRELSDRMRRGENVPFGGGLGDMQRMMDRMFQRQGPFGFGRGRDDGPMPEGMPEEIEKMFRDMFEGEGMRMVPEAGDMRGIEQMLQQQASARKPSEHERAHSGEISKYNEVVAAARRSTVEIRSGDKLVALGTVVAENGYILTKASQLSDDVTVKLAGNKSLKAKIVGIEETFDLALLKVDARGLVAVQWQRGDAPPVGSLLATPGTGVEALAAGVVSVAPRRPLEVRGFLGVGHELTDAGVEVTRVLPGTAAASAGIRMGDIIRKVDDTNIDTPTKLIEAVGNRKPGDKIALLIRRGNQDVKTNALLGTRQMAGMRVRRYNVMDRMGSQLSERREGFPFVLQHDCVLAPEDCGGPLVDLSGKAVGVNIARSGRVSSYAIPASTVLELLPELMTGKLAPSDPATAVEL